MITDPNTREVLDGFGIDPDKTPQGSVKYLRRDQYQALSMETFKWSMYPENDNVIAYAIDNEQKPGVGLVLRNLHRGKEKAKHLTEVPKDVQGPYWHNFHFSLETVWQTGVVVLVEGPKDARFLAQYGIPTWGYLGGVPSTEHLNCTQKYVHTAIWIPDNDNMTYEVKRRREDVQKSAERIGLRLRRLTINAKDPAELKGNIPEIRKILSSYQLACRLGGGGYKWDGRLNTGLDA